MFCKNCGNNLDENALVCDRCGASVSGQQSFNENGYGKERVLSKKEYFKSRMITDKAKSMRTANWVIFGIYTAFSALLVLGLVFATIGFAMIGDTIDFSNGMVEGFKNMPGTEIYGESEWEILEEAEKTLEIDAGMAFKELWDLLPIVCIILIIGIVAMIVLLLIAVKSVNLGCAIAFTAISVFFGGWIVIAGAVAVLVMTILLNKEYKEYTENINLFSATGGNEPNFS